MTSAAACSAVPLASRYNWPARQERPGPPADRDAAPGLAAWCRARPVDRLRQGVRYRIVKFPPGCNPVGIRGLAPNQAPQRTAAAVSVLGSECDCING